jgi:hypothetical protein
MDFKKLVEESKDWVLLSKKLHYDFDSILSGLYNNPSHFIYEILQNAEDALAKEVKFDLFDDHLDIYHNGRDFDFADIQGVTGIGISTKKSDLTAIGKFGVGFKSVFAVTETPHIFSGDYKIRIEDFVVPTEVMIDAHVKGTLIRLPFNHKMRSEKEVFDLVCKKLENIGLKTLLFLKNIDEIKWRTPLGSGHYFKEIKELPDANRVTIISERDIEEYIVLGRPIRIENKELKVKVAYRLGKDKNNKEIIVQEPDSRLVVFFPTEKVTFLNFLIQGPYKTTPNRENIPLDDEQNKKIINETGVLVAESLSTIKNLGYLDTNFLNILPIHPAHKDKEPIYSAIYEKVKEMFLSDKELLPTNETGSYANISSTVLARGKELTEFLDEKDLRMLFSKKYWLCTNITYDKTKELRDYLINDLGIVEVDFETFAKKISQDFLQTKPDDWMISFYGRLLDQQALWRDRGFGLKSGILRIKPIIRTSSNEHIAPFDSEGKAHVYLPAETKSEYKTVKRSLIQNDDSLKFLKELGLTKPDLFAEVKEFILPKYMNGCVTKDEGYIEDFEKLLTAYETVPSGKKHELISQLSHAPFIDSINYITHERNLRKPSEVYLNDSELRKYFHGSTTTYFVSDELYERFKDRGLVPFLLEIGVEESPRRIETSGNLSWEERHRLQGSTGHTRDVYQKDYDYEELNSYIGNIDSEKSLLLWTLLLKSIKSLDSWKARYFFRGEYKWFYRTEHTAHFDAAFLRILKQEKWLVDKNGNFSKPADITFSDLSDRYHKESPNIEILAKELAFKPGIIDQLPEEVRKKYLLTKDLPLKDLEKILAEYKRKSGNRGKSDEGKAEKEWKPECEPNEVEIEFKEAVFKKIVITDLEGQSEKMKAGKIQEEDYLGGNHPETKEIEEEVEKLSAFDKERIGTWGEEAVLNTLRKEFLRISSNVVTTESGFKVLDINGDEIEIIWLNKNNNVGRGCDLVRKVNGEEVEYIEVKSKLRGEPELIEITGTQWEFSRALYDKGEGWKYSIYVVPNAGQKSANKISKINDPIRKWKEGNLYAHPVNFKL